MIKSRLWGFLALKKIVSTRRYKYVCFSRAWSCEDIINLQILRTSNSFHQQFAMQTSSAAVTSDLFVVWHPGLCSKCLLIHGSFSGNPADPQKAHIQSKPTAVLKKLNNLIDMLLSLKKKSSNWNRCIAQSWSTLLKKSHENKKNYATVS